MIQYDSCPFCKSTSIQQVLTAVDHTIDKEKFNIYHCEQCTGRFTNPVPDQDSIGKYYQSEEYVSHSNTSKGFINGIYQKVRAFTLIRKRKLVHALNGGKAGRILDIGCGTGDFLSQMKDIGWDTLGIEPDQGARKLAIDNHKLNVLPQDQFYGLEENSFDVLSMWHVLEHVHELHTYLEKLHSLLKSSGTLMIAVPNYTSYDARYYKEFWAAYDVPRHLYHFSPASMKVLLESKGFELVRKKGMPFDPFYVSMLSEKYKGGNMLKGITIGKLSWFKSLSNVDSASSLIYIAKKK